LRLTPQSTWICLITTGRCVWRANKRWVVTARQRWRL
jgi:hypothetical protein